MWIRICAVALLVSSSLLVRGQDPQRFREEVQEILAANKNVSSRKLNLFTGSSSIRLWSDLKERFGGYNVANTAFGGSQTSELFYFSEELILRHKPSRIFIYEGDNDLGAGKTPEQVLEDTRKLVLIMRGVLPKRAKIYFITPKPSPRRWDMKGQYEAYITLLKSWARENRVTVIDVWTPMIGSDGKVREDLFLEDQLHMNKAGYDIWEPLIRPHLKRK